MAKSKPKGIVRYPPFENLDAASLREMRKFDVYPSSHFQDLCRHIPYNSGKKDFYHKTGRDSFEGELTHSKPPAAESGQPINFPCVVFQYTFKVPSDDSEYVVMWDYNVGLVRMTPFFKCCKYQKVCCSLERQLPPNAKVHTH